MKGREGGRETKRLPWVLLEKKWDPWPNSLHLVQPSDKATPNYTSISPPSHAEVHHRRHSRNSRVRVIEPNHNLRERLARSPAVTDEGEMPPPGYVLEGLPRVHVILLVVRNARAKSLVSQGLTDFFHFR